MNRLAILIAVAMVGVLFGCGGSGEGLTPKSLPLKGSLRGPIGGAKPVKVAKVVKHAKPKAKVSMPAR